MRPAVGPPAPLSPSRTRELLGDPVLWGLLAAGLAIRTWLVFRYPYLHGMGDEFLHYAMSVLTSHFGPRVLGHWAPGYEVFLGATFWATGPDPFSARLAQVLLSMITVGLVYAMARQAGGRRAARIAAALLAFDPTLIAYTHHLFSETLFTALLAAAIYPLFRHSPRRSTADCVVSGLLFGLATLTRSLPFYFLVLWVLWAALRQRGPKLRQAAIVLGVATAVVAPWTIRNAFKYQGFLLVDGTLGTTAYFAFSEVFFSQDLGVDDWRRYLPRSREQCRVGDAPGMRPLPPVEELRELFPMGWKGLLPELRYARGLLGLARHDAMIDVVEQQRCELRRASEFARDHPGIVASSMLRRLYVFWGPNSFLLRWVKRATYADGPLASSSYGLFKWLVVALHVTTVAAAILLMGRRGPPPIATWSAAFIAYYTVLHMLSVACSRYRLPLLPLLAVMASIWLAGPRAPQGRVPRALVGALLLVFVSLCAHYAAVVLP